MYYVRELIVRAIIFIFKGIFAFLGFIIISIQNIFKNPEEKKKMDFTDYATFGGDSFSYILLFLVLAGIISIFIIPFFR